MCVCACVLMGRTVWGEVMIRWESDHDDEDNDQYDECVCAVVCD